MKKTSDALRLSSRVLPRRLVVPVAVLVLTLAAPPSTEWAAEAVKPPQSSAAEAKEAPPAQPGSVKALDLGKVQAPADAASLRGPEVVATGVGTDPQSATQNALVNAVSQVVGILVDAETIVSNDKIVRDQVLTYSRGFVEDHQEIARWQENGLHYVRIRALVSATRLGEKLTAQNVVLRPIEGDKIAIRIRVEELNEEAARQMFRKAVADITDDRLFTVTIAEGKPAVERGPNGVKLTVSYTLAANYAAWKQIRANLVPVLDRISSGRKRPGSALVGQGWQFTGAKLAGDTLYVFKEVGPDGVTTDWEEYAVPEYLLPDVRAVADRNCIRYAGRYEGYAVILSLLDDQDRVIAKTERFFAQQEITVLCPTVAGYLVFDWTVQPEVQLGRHYSIGPILKAWSFSETFTLDTDQLEKVKNVAATIGYTASSRRY